MKTLNVIFEDKDFDLVARAITRADKDNQREGLIDICKEYLKHEKK